MPPPSDPANSRELLERFPTREAKLLRIREIERKLEKWEKADEENDPTLIEGQIRMERGVRIGCGAFFLCIALMAWRAWSEGHKWSLWLLIAMALAGLYKILQGVSDRPDPKLIMAAYQPNRAKREYRDLVEEMETLTRALSQDLRAEDAGDAAPGA